MTTAGPGILVIGYARPALLQAVLESLARQNALDQTHVWIDGTAGRMELSAANVETARVARSYRPREVVAHEGHLGIEKLMLDGLAAMSRRYESMIVLEDDCFPTADAVAAFTAMLNQIAAEPQTYSVYGHHFDVPAEGDTITRFQGWGWATTRARLTPVLAELTRLHALAEADYRRHVQRSLTDEVIARLDVTPGRNVIEVMQRFFSWDSATSLITAQRGMVHRRTPRRVVYNCGLGNDSGHFVADARFRDAPFNMIEPGEVWQHFDAGGASTAVAYHGLEDLDAAIEGELDVTCGTFVELGAFDGVTQSNTRHLESRGWRGILIEPVPAAWRECRDNRPLATVINCACVAADDTRTSVAMAATGLMSLVRGTRTAAEEEEWISRGESLQALTREEIEVPARTLQSVLDAQGMTRVDLLSLDVEGGELDVLKGLDFTRTRPRFIACEDPYDDTVCDYLAGQGYAVQRQLSARKFTRDVLYRDTRGTVPRHAGDKDVDTAAVKLRLNPERVEGPDGLVFDLRSRRRFAMPETTAPALRQLGQLGPRFTRQQAEQRLEDPFGDITARLVADGWLVRDGDASLTHLRRSLNIETCTSCVGRCGFCPVSENPNARPRFMPLSLLEDILAATQRYRLNFVALNIYSEPLLHPEFLEQVALVKRYGQQLALFTTGALLTPEISKQLADLDATDRVVINLPSIDPEEYRRYMGVKFPNHLVANVRAAAAAGLPVSVAINGISDCNRRYQAIVAALEGSNVDVFVNLTHDRAGASTSSEAASGGDHHGKLRGCRRSMEDITVGVDGKVILCCQDYHQRHVLGDLATTALEDILDGAAALDLRQQIFGERDADADLICHGCAEAWYDTDPGPLPATTLV
ncbi:MAG: FkbM family methyltransferase [Gammaproteobacteria bacterium]|nr:FkbM family methyltransferase [Gammaproteobacteria bacterium]